MGVDPTSSQDDEAAEVRNLIKKDLENCSGTLRSTIALHVKLAATLKVDGVDVAEGQEVEKVKSFSLLIGAEVRRLQQFPRGFEGVSSMLIVSFGNELVGKCSKDALKDGITCAMEYFEAAGTRDALVKLVDNIERSRKDVIDLIRATMAPNVVSTLPLAEGFDRTVIDDNGDMEVALATRLTTVDLSEVVTTIDHTKSVLALLRKVDAAQNQDGSIMANSTLELMSLAMPCVVAIAKSTIAEFATPLLPEGMSTADIAKIELPASVALDRFWDAFSKVTLEFKALSPDVIAKSAPDSALRTTLKKYVDRVAKDVAWDLGPGTMGGRR